MNGLCLLLAYLSDKEDDFVKIDLKDANAHSFNYADIPSLHLVILSNEVRKNPMPALRHHFSMSGSTVILTSPAMPEEEKNLLFN